MQRLNQGFLTPGPEGSSPSGDFPHDFYLSTPRSVTETMRVGHGTTGQGFRK